LFIIQIVLLYVGLSVLISASKAKVGEGARIMSNLIAALIVIAMPAFLFTQLPSMTAWFLGPDDPRHDQMFADFMRNPAMVWIRHEWPLFLTIAITWFAISIFCLVIQAAEPHARRAAARWEARRAFVHLHTGPLVAPTRERLAGLWGPRPDEMTRCVECGRNEWPACRCALMREGYAMTSEPPAPEVPLGQFTLPPWGSPSDSCTRDRRADI
jgi:hypothetical protein